jgi:hypothetical protein
VNLTAGRPHHLAFLLLLALPSISAVAAPRNSRAEYCQALAQPGYFRELAFDPLNHLSFPNHGGLFNGGVCWWHSLFQRAALYLAVFRPEQAKPSESEARRIIHSLAAGKKVVEIPGYSNLYGFSLDWAALIQAKLEEWQMVDGFLKFAWIKGLSGSNNVDPAEIEETLSAFAEKLNTDQEILWSMWQLEGITAHSTLILNVEMGPLTSNVTHLDSNFVGEVPHFSYQVGDRSIFYPPYEPFVPYSGRDRDLRRFKKARERYCSNARAENHDRLEALDNEL